MSDGKSILWARIKNVWQIVRKVLSFYDENRLSYFHKHKKWDRKRLFPEDIAGKVKLSDGIDRN